MRFLAIDLGERRSGIATGDDVVGLVQPLEVLAVPRGDALIEALARTIADVAPDLVVVGLPLNMDGSEGPAAASVRAFGQRIAERTRVPIAYQDERLTSFSAEESLKRSGRTHGEKRDLRDALAAAEILRDHLASRRQDGQDARETDLGDDS